MKTTYVMYDPAVWNSNPRGAYWDSYFPLSDYIRSRGIPLYTLEELHELDAMGALDLMSDADRETLFREARQGQAE